MKQRGFTLVELIAVMVLIGALSAIVIPRMVSSNNFQLMASRDQVVSAFLSAQQLAMHRVAPVQLRLENQIIDIRVDQNNNGIFESSESVRAGGVRYPLQILSKQSFDATTFQFDRLGQPSGGGDIVIRQQGQSVLISVSSAGFVE